MSENGPAFSSSRNRRLLVGILCALQQTAIFSHRLGHKGQKLIVIERGDQWVELLGQIGNLDL